MATRRSRSPADRRRRAVAVLLVTVCFCVVACGGGSDASSPLSAKERSGVNGALATLGSYCRQVGLYFSQRGGAPTAAQTKAAENAVDEIAAIARSKPGVEYRPGQTMRLLVGDTAEDLEANDCSGPLVARLNQALASIPPASP
jgi:hypothetical protein